MMLRALTAAAVMLLAACAPAPQVETARLNARPDFDLPPMRMFGAANPIPPHRPNGQMARDFLDLTFRLESGRALPVFTRFEGPVTVRVSGSSPPTLIPDLDALIGRLRNEAGIDIRRIPSGEANVTIETVPRDALRRVVPQAACFVTPRVSSWDQFRTARGSDAADWTTLTSRERLAIFIPRDVAPQEIRDCLHEELAQALGPLDDLYRLSDSIFNDDNFNSVLSGFDMLMLRVTYAPELHSGMSEDQVAARLPAILYRLNPAGGKGRIQPEVETPRAWIKAVETALGPEIAPPRRRAAAREAVSLAQRRGWRDTRRAFSLYVLGRLTIGTEPNRALGDFRQADRIFRASPYMRVQAAHVAMQFAAYALSAGHPDEAIAIAEANIPAAIRAQNAALMAQLMLMKATALDAQNRASEARVVRTEALGWARYGFGSATEVRVRAGEIAALALPVDLASVK